MDDIEGQIILDVRRLAGEIPDGLLWTIDTSRNFHILELSDGSLLIPVRDSEGNGPGAWQGKGVEDWNDLEGSIIESIEPMSPAAMEHRGWSDQSDYRPPVLSLNTGEQLFPTADSEGNQFGILYRVQDRETFIIDFERVEE